MMNIWNKEINAKKIKGVNDAIFTVVAITTKSTNEMFAYLHWEVWVLLVILENISDTLVNHGE